MAVATMDPATALTWIQIQTSNAHDMRAAISEVERFDGELGDLAHFIKAGDRISKAIASKETACWLEANEVPVLKAAMINRISRRVLNIIQCDEGTPWEVVKDRLKKAYGGGRWAPEEDILRMFRESRGSRQTAGEFAHNLIRWYTKIAEKLSEQMPAAEMQAKMQFLETVLQVQLKRETGKTLATDRTFLEQAREIIDEDSREAEDEPRAGDGPWIPVRNRRTISTRPPDKEWGRRNRDEGRRRVPERSRDKLRRLPERRKCYKCGSTRHLAAGCEQTNCFECGEPGHIARRCPHLYRRETNRGEPMEVNTQRVEPRRRTFAETARRSATSSESSDESEKSVRTSWTRRSGLSRRLSTTVKTEQ